MEKDKNYRCEKCGGTMEFDPKAQTLKCPNCGNEVEILDDGSGQEEHPLTRRAKNLVRAAEKKSKTMKCTGCGAEIEVDAGCASVTCPYCGANYVLASEQRDVELPDGIIPFKVEKKEVGRLLAAWLKKRMLAPGSLKNLFQEGKIDGIYLPYYTFDADALAFYTGMGGRVRTETYEDSDGNTHTRTYTDWYPTSGTVEESFDDLKEPASSTMPRRLAEKDWSFDTAEAKAYSEDYFSGFRSQIMTRDLEDAHRSAVSTMEAALVAAAERDICGRYDEASDVRIRPTFSNETYRLLSLPFYAGSYLFKGKTYTVMINGETGAVEGEYPKSVAKILLIIVIVIALFILFYLWINS